MSVIVLVLGLVQCFPKVCGRLACMHLAGGLGVHSKGEICFVNFKKHMQFHMILDHYYHIYVQNKIGDNK